MDPSLMNKSVKDRRLDGDFNWSSPDVPEWATMLLGKPGDNPERVFSDGYRAWPCENPAANYEDTFILVPFVWVVVSYRSGNV